MCGEVTRRLGEPFPTPLPPDIVHILGTRDPFATLAAAIGRTPVWAFHGSLDDTIPVRQSRRMVAALRASGTEVHYTEYDDGDHYTWDCAYGDPQLAEWMMSR